jgi:hypothetical protein
VLLGCRGALGFSGKLVNHATIPLRGGTVIAKRVPARDGVLRAALEGVR